MKRAGGTVGVMSWRGGGRSGVKSEVQSSGAKKEKEKKCSRSQKRSLFHLAPLASPRLGHSNALPTPLRPLKNADEPSSIKFRASVNLRVRARERAASPKESK